MIKPRGEKFALVSRAGKTLGTHTTKKQAVKQEVAIKYAQDRAGRRRPQRAS